MKICPNCGNQLQDDALFCPNCGSMMNAEQPAYVQPEVEQPVAVQPEYTENPPVVYAEEPAPKKGKGKLIGLICGGVAIVAVVVFLIIGFATNWFGGPLGGLTSALEKTLKADSLTLELEIEAKMDDEEQTSDSLMKIVLDKDNKELTLLYETDTGSSASTFLIADGKGYTYGTYDDEILYATCEDVPKENIEKLFDALNGELEQDDEELEKLLEQYDIKADVDEVRDFLKKLDNECFKNQEWLEKFLGYEKKKDKYTFEIDVKDLLKDLGERAYEADIINRSKYKDIKEMSLDMTLEVEIKVKDGYVKEIYFGTEQGEITMGYTIEISDLNDTEISEKDIDVVKTAVNTYIEENYADCAGCGENDKKEYMYEANSDYYCRDCFYERDYCDVCNKFVLEDSLKYANYDDMCPDCYSSYESTHKCDLCGSITGSNYICYEHSWYDYCDDCGRLRTLNYYNVSTKKQLCYYCY